MKLHLLTRFLSSSALFVFLLAAPVHAQNSPAPPSAAPKPPPPAAPAPSPVNNDPRALIDRLNPDDLTEAIKLLRANYVNPGQVNDPAIARATLDGLLGRLGGGVLILAPQKPPEPNAPAPREELPGELRAETFPNRVGYLRLGALTREHVGDLDRALRGFAADKLIALILDLRATSAARTGDDPYELAAEVIRRFVPKGRPLFTLKKPNPNGAQDRLFTSNAAPLYTGRLFLLTDADTAGSAEVIAASLHTETKALIVGAPTAGQAVEYADFGLSNGSILRVAVAQIVLPPNDASIFPGGVKPDLAVVQNRSEKLDILRQSAAQQPQPTMMPFVFETERPHFNEAALVTGNNPELDAARDAQARRREGQPALKPPPRDVPLQRAMDLATTIEMFESKPQPVR